MKKAIAYYRVSTKRQGHSGLGLSAQKTSVLNFAKLHKYKIIREFKEVESTRKNKRLKLQQALIECKKTDALLLIAKLDRLHRNVVFISSLMESDIDFIAVDNPNANRLMLHILAAFAEHERDQISRRTKEALAAAKRRGVQLGKYGKIQAQKNKEASIKFALKMKPLIEQLQSNGFKSLRKLSHKLNKLKIKTFSGGGAKWHPTSVHKILIQIG